MIVLDLTIEFESISATILNNDMRIIEVKADACFFDEWMENRVGKAVRNRAAEMHSIGQTREYEQYAQEFILHFTQNQLKDD